MTTFQYRKISTTIGELYLIGDGKAVEYILFEGSLLPEKYQRQMVENRRAFEIAAKEIKQYLAGKLTRFTFPIKLTVQGFQKRALLALTKVRYGETISYGELALLAGTPNASRAAGSACANNPLPLVIPCHRVIKSDGRLGGFGGGEKLKRKLLDLEKAKYKL